MAFSALSFFFVIIVPLQVDDELNVSLIQTPTLVRLLLTANTLRAGEIIVQRALSVALCDRQRVLAVITKVAHAIGQFAQQMNGPVHPSVGARSAVTNPAAAIKMDRVQDPRCRPAVSAFAQSPTKQT
jgi:hypothetical protein